MALNAKRTRFVAEYLKDLNGTQAAIRAGYSEKTAYSQADRLLNYAEVRSEIERRQAKLAEKHGITVDRIIEELAKIGLANMGDYTRLAGSERVIDLSETTRDQLAAVSEMTVEDFTLGRGDDARDVRRVKVKLADKRAALVDLGKHLGMFREKIDLTVTDDFAAQLIKARERAGKKS